MKITTIQNDSRDQLQVFLSDDRSSIVFRHIKSDSKGELKYDDFEISDKIDIQSLVQDLDKLSRDFSLLNFL